ncbi:MAG: aldo/keto reductase [Candidatus Omnitrophota bacterium]
MIKKICLGTVQFGMDYGVANKRGKVPPEEVFDILKYTARQGIGFLDTAGAYGKSESLIGECCRKEMLEFEIVSKLSSVEQGSAEAEQFIDKKLKCTLSDLGRESLYGYLIHSFKDFVRDPDIWDIFQALKKRKKLGKIGFSLYAREEAEFLEDRQIAFDIVQVPYSVFDRRFEPYFEKWRKKGIKIFARSVFLQGAAFMDPDKLKGILGKAGARLNRLNELSKRYKIPLHAICLNFALLNPDVDHVIIGVDSLGQAKMNLAAVDYASEIQDIMQDLRQLAIEDEDVLLPYLWSNYLMKKGIL